MSLVLTTTNTIDGHRVIKYIGIVTGEAILGTDVFADYTARIRDVVGGRAGGYQRVMRDARDKALDEMEEFAKEYGANAVIGVDIDYQALGENDTMLMVSANGTAVIIEPIP